MTDTTTYPLSVITSAILGSEATSPSLLAAEMVSALELHGYLCPTGGDQENAWSAIHERIFRLYGRVTDRELADATLTALRDNNFLLDFPIDSPA